MWLLPEQFYTNLNFLNFGDAVLYSFKTFQLKMNYRIEIFLGFHSIYRHVQYNIWMFIRMGAAEAAADWSYTCLWREVDIGWVALHRPHLRHVSLLPPPSPLARALPSYSLTKTKTLHSSSVRTHHTHLLTAVYSTGLFTFKHCINQMIGNFKVLFIWIQKCKNKNGIGILLLNCMRRSSAYSYSLCLKKNACC